MESVEKFNEFWQWFQKNEQKFYQLNEENAGVLLDKINTRIRRVDKRLSVLFSAPLIDGKKELVVTSEGKVDAFPVVLKLTDYAPELPNWRICSLKPRIDLGPDSLPGLAFQGRNFRATDFYFQCVPVNGRLYLDLYVKNYNQDDYELTYSAFLTLIDMILGEYDVCTKIGEIKIHNLLSKKDLYPLLDLVTIVDNFKEVH